MGAHGPRQALEDRLDVFHHNATQTHQIGNVLVRGHNLLIVASDGQVGLWWVELIQIL